MGLLRVAALCVLAACSSAGDTETVDETCNGLDDDGDTRVDEDPVDGQTYFVDDDGDTYGRELRACAQPPMTVQRGGDCHDDNVDAFPGSTSTETPKDGIDTDCDGNDFCTDLNCDGRADIVVPSHHDGDYNITQAARLLSGPGGWQLETTQVNMYGTLGVAVGDLDNDGTQDVVHASYHDGTTVNTNSFIYWGGSAHSQAMRTALPTHGAHWVCLADFDGNGWTDIVFANNTDGDSMVNSYLYRNRPGGFAELDRIVLPTPGGATHCSVDDLNGDTFLDIVFSNYTGGTAGMSSIYWGSAAADYPTASRTDLPTVGTYANTIVDLDKDGKKDIIFWSHYNGTSYQTNDNYIYWNRDGFSTANRTAFFTNGGFRGAVDDLNGDGYNDIITPGYHNNGWQNMAPAFVYWGNAANNYSAANRISITVRGVLEVQVDDINADGYKDILMSSNHDGDSYAPQTIMWGTAAATYVDANRTELPGYHVQRGAKILDFNRDGFKDIFFPGYHNNQTGMDPTPWANQAYSRIYWGSAQGLRATFYDQWPTRGAWAAAVVGQ